MFDAERSGTEGKELRSSLMSANKIDGQRWWVRNFITIELVDAE